MYAEYLLHSCQRLGFNIPITFLLTFFLFFFALSGNTLDVYQTHFLLTAFFVKYFQMTFHFISKGTFSTEKHVDGKRTAIEVRGMFEIVNVLLIQVC